MAQSGIGAAATRPEEDSVSIATSYDLDQDMKMWAAPAAIARPISGNRNV